MGGPRSTSAPWFGLLHTATAELAARLGSTTTQVSRTVRQLREAGLVRSERDGKLVSHRLATDVLRRLGDDVLATVMR